MDTATLVQIFMGVVIMLLGWWNNSLNSRMKRIEETLDKLRDSVFSHREASAKDYATKEDIKGIHNRLDVILTLLPGGKQFSA